MRTAFLLVGGALALLAGVILYIRTAAPLGLRAGLGHIAPGWRTEAERVHFSTDGLSDASPQLSARQTLDARQRDWLIGAGVALVVGAVLALRATLIALVALSTAAYVGSMAVRIWLFLISLRAAQMVSVPEADAYAAAGDVLKSYTVLVPAFHEPEVMAALVEGLRGLDYPADRLQVLLLLEADDEVTIAAARTAIGTARDIRLLIVPPGGPRTKPKALNYGLTHATGSYLTIFDAEDRPDPLQLRKAAIAFSRLPSDVACMQARLSFFNGRQNLITRWFQAEYSTWFRQMLPALSQLGAPVPLGGTSNHFRTDVLLDLGAWDPNNVTEDADLGVRLSRAGYRSVVLDSVTLEEANSDFVNWAKQRSRWYKGYLQTFLVHVRGIGSTYRSMGLRQMTLFGFIVGGTPLMAMVNSVFWMLTVIWFSVRPAWLQAMFPAPLYYLGLLTWLGGNFVFTFISMLEAIEVDDALFFASLLTPLYWVMMSVASFKALMQVVFAPTYWEKTRHGLTGTATARPTP